MIISLIAALTTNRVIGIKNVIPWHLPIDMEWFKYHTFNKPIIMGRRTFESIGAKPLKNRLNIVLSHFLKNNYNGVYIVKNINQALFLAKNFYEVMIIGGSEVYSVFLPQSKRLYLTYVSNSTTYIYGDTWFPMYNINEWKPIFSKFYSVNDKKGNYYSLNFNILERL